MRPTFEESFTAWERNAKRRHRWSRESILVWCVGLPVSWVLIYLAVKYASDLRYGNG